MRGFRSAACAVMMTIAIVLLMATAQVGATVDRDERVLEVLV